jgi:catechol 2,3-dioxygenase-like lactoylglutathione lyase family enzyme
MKVSMPARAYYLLIAVLASDVAAVPATQSPAGRPRITGINHVAFRVSDAAAARRFYGDFLGLVERPGAGASRITYAIGARQYVALEPGLPATEDERLAHLAFETADLKALVAYLSSRGLTVQSRDTCQVGSVVVTDRDGHPIEFVQGQWPPPAAKGGSDRALSNRLLHAGLTIRDEQAAHTFYRETLGFSEIWRGGRPEGVTQWVNMRVPDGTDYLEYMFISDTPDRRRLGSLHHMALLVPDIQAAWEEAVRRTPEAVRAPLNPPQVGVNGRWQLNLFDPDGTRTELMEPFRIR